MIRDDCASELNNMTAPSLSGHIRATFSSCRLLSIVHLLDGGITFLFKVAAGGGREDGR